ncbi:hypothetical protein G7Y89_g7066 [Cudoniella acicularis]|uniref:Uncharacterized protein n=1 Tax=Cudoniella acicularis TaxID=354080 RepID=A0A8H4W2F3_9HELO|nr:hypothetical protein G7Y89_g7066 [Cudoniella acicularis]
MSIKRYNACQRKRTQLELVSALLDNRCPYERLAYHLIDMAGASRDRGRVVVGLPQSPSTTSLRATFSAAGATLDHTGHTSDGGNFWRLGSISALAYPRQGLRRSAAAPPAPPSLHVHAPCSTGHDPHPGNLCKIPVIARESTPPRPGQYTESSLRANFAADRGHSQCTRKAGHEDWTYRTAPHSASHRDIGTPGAGAGYGHCFDTWARRRQLMCWAMRLFHAIRRADQEQIESLQVRTVLSRD